MNQEEINLAFENRWRVKANLDGKGHIKGAFIPFVSSEHQEEILLHIKTLCRDFFEAGILISERPVCCCTTTTTHDEDEQTTLSFDQWWDMYGKKVDRAKCEKKWEKLSLAEKQACIAATPAYVASTPDLQYRRHPATYLNNKSWENQIIPHSNGTNKPTIEQQRISKLVDILTE